MTNISNTLIDKYSSGPTEATENGLQTTRDNIVKLLGSNYDVFLQGSYKNDTAIYDINDIDIVAVRISNVPHLWEDIFDDIQAKVSSFAFYRGKVTKGNKCVKLVLQNKKVDVVPAVRQDVYNGSRNSFDEPIQVFDRAKQVVIHNYPKTHYDNGAKKNKSTNGNYKKCVRLMKNFVKNHNGTDTAPSFYLECLIYSYSDASFAKNSLIESFYFICNHIANATDFNVNFKSVAKDKTTISNTEWSNVNFIKFRNYLKSKLPYLQNAVNARNTTDADKNFRLFFNI